MKKFLALAITAAMLLSFAVIGTSAAEVYDGTSVSASLSGAGTEADPYLIANGADLAFFAANAVAGASYKLTADIVWASAAEATNWTPVEFNGTFDGNGHSISGLCVKGEKNAAFFATAAGAIKNLTIKDSTFEGSKYIAAIVGQVVAADAKESAPSLTIENCVSYATLISTKNSSLIGSMIGDAFANAKTPNYLTVTVSGCVNYGTISSTTDGTVYVGGIIGRTYGIPAIVENCANLGDLNSISAITGGIVGQGGISGDTYEGFSTKISNCLNTGNATGKRICGGIIGRAYPGVYVDGCVNTGSMTITATDAAKDGYNDQLGPITGHGPDARADAATFVNCGEITNCYNSAEAVFTNSNDAAAKPFYASLATNKTAAELNSAATVTALGDAWELKDGVLTLKIVATAGQVESAQPEVTEPEVTEPAPEDTKPADPVPTGDSALVFAVIAIISVLGVAAVAKRREN